MHLLLQRLLFLLQGAGNFVEGEATLTNSNVFENEALLDKYGYNQLVSALHLNLPTGSSSAALLENGTCTRGWQGGGAGLYITGTATLTNTKVYANNAMVCRSLEPSSSAGWHSHTHLPGSTEQGLR